MTMMVQHTHMQDHVREFCEPTHHTLCTWEAAAFQFFRVLLKVLLQLQAYHCIEKPVKTGDREKGSFWILAKTRARHEKAADLLTGAGKLHQAGVSH